MFSVRAFLGAFVLGAAASLLAHLLSTLATGFAMASCCLSFALYPLVGAGYAYLHAGATRPLASAIVGGPAAASAVLVWQLLFAAVTSPTDPIASFRQGLSPAAELYGDNPAFLAVAVLVGFSIAFSFVASMGAVGAVLIRALLQKRTSDRPNGTPIS